MTAAIIITLCLLLLLAYFFDVTAPRTKIPSIILLLLCGWAVRQVSGFLDFHLPDLTPLLPILGTIGLILIVLEGSLELELNRSKAGIIGKSVLVALVPILMLTFIFAFGLHYYTETPLRICLINAIPLSVISSAIAISSVKHMPLKVKEFITYESSLSDIFGVLLFNFVAINDMLDVASVLNFTLQIIIILVISFAGTLGLSFLLNRINHRIKFAPIILLVILIYEVSKIYHLPSLIFILLFGIFLGNLDELKKIKWIQKLNPDELDKEVHKFKDIITESTFLVRSVFFLLFGYLIETKELLNAETLLISVAVTILIFLTRLVILKIVLGTVKPLLFIAPRGLITILLFLAILPEDRIPVVSRSLVLQVIILSAFIMMFGMIFHKNEKHSDEPENK